MRRNHPTALIETTIALAGIGYDELGGYTIFTGGVAVPEPATMSLVALGALALLHRRRRA